ncbi:MaoC family dehydratase [Hutsoniella sourekii]|uniref:MaoC family dehydratase n=1 Tax=Hutsoniella sourekii TaxID=87650 RepID=UPI0004AE1D53|nr:MaoC family dehydratase [Hutsoniella sourekii]
MAEITQTTSYHDLQVGDTIQSEPLIASDERIQLFAEATGDFNPIHLDEQAGKASRYGARVAHGMFGATMVTGLVGTLFPGSIYVSQDFRFRQPVYIGDQLTCQIEIIAKKDKGQFVDAKTTIINQDGQKVITGKARVILP